MPSMLSYFMCECFWVFSFLFWWGRGVSFPSHVRRMLLFQARADVVPSVGAWTGGRLAVGHVYGGEWANQQLVSKGN